MPRHHRPRRLSDAELLEELIVVCVQWLLAERPGDAYADSLWRELHRRRLGRVDHRTGCACEDCCHAYDPSIDLPDHPLI